MPRHVSTPEVEPALVRPRRAGKPSAQATLVDYQLHTLGWKAFQDLAVAVATELLGTPVETFLSSRDGGRDGAFIGTLNGSRSTIQCKFTSRRDATLSAGDLDTELTKVAALAARGLANDYVIITNYGVSGVVANKHRTAISSYRQSCLFFQRCGDSYHASILSTSNPCARANVRHAAPIPNELRTREPGRTCDGRRSPCLLQSPCQIDPCNRMAVEQHSRSRKCHCKSELTVMLSLT